MIPRQVVTLVSSGGEPTQLADQRGAPYPTTGYGALVFNTGPYIIDAKLENVTILGGGNIAPIDSPHFTGDPWVPTPPFGDDDDSIPNTSWVQDEIDAGNFVSSTLTPAPKLTVGPTPPSSPAVNDLWVDTN